MPQAAGHFLILFPGDPHWAPGDMAVIVQALHAIGFIGEERAPLLFSAGPEYLNLITYLGCSPQISLGENEAATTIRLRGIHDSSCFLSGANLKSPRCPHCRRNLEKPAASVSVQESMRCPHCAHAGAIQDFDWRRSAAFARVFIEISNVFESEAVPGEGLTDCLQKTTGEVWDYCYVRREGC